MSLYLAIFLLGFSYGAIAWILFDRQFYKSFLIMTQSAINLVREMQSGDPSDDDPEREDLPEDTTNANDSNTPQTKIAPVVAFISRKVS